MRISIVGLVAAFLLAGCGVPLQPSAQPIPEDVIPAPIALPTATASPEPQEPVPTVTATPPELVRLWFVREDGLVGVETEIPDARSAPDILQSLAVGPSEQDAASGLRTVSRDPLTGQSLVSIYVQPQTDEFTPQGVETVALSPAFAALPPTEQVLLLGQVVLSLTGSVAEAVDFVDESGTPVAVPLPDGRLLDLPATARDYSSLISQL
jgi:hypothetical protein